MTPFEWSGLYASFTQQTADILKWIMPMMVIGLAIMFGGSVIAMLFNTFTGKKSFTAKVTMGQDSYWTTKGGLNELMNQKGTLITRGRPKVSTIHYIDEDTGVEQGSAVVEEYDDKAL